MSWNEAVSETALVAMASEAIRKRLPPGWTLDDRGREQRQTSGSGRPDAVLHIADPWGSSAVILVEAKRRPVEAREALAQLHRWWRMLSAQEGESPGLEGSPTFMVVAPYLGPSARERLSEAGISFADSTGNIRVVINRPAAFIEAQGVSRNPWREPAPLHSLKGPRTARVVRGFLDYQAPFGTRELASAIETSPASVSRVSDLLEREAIVRRETPRGRILSVDWERLVRRWADDYDFINANEMKPWLEPRGIRTLFDRLRDADFTYAVTGSLAAVRFASVAEPRLAVIYVADPSDAADRLGLRPADTGGNVLMGPPFDSVVFERTQLAEGITYARVTQVLVDLMKGPGRGPAEAESLVEWMRGNEDTWRRPLTRTT